MEPTNYSALADRYAAHRRPNPEVLRRLLGVLEPSSRVLEVGCGTGNYVSALHGALGCECVALDPNAEMLSKLRARALPIRIVQAPAEALTVDSAAFDLIYSVDVIHHVRDLGAAFREAFRALCAGGRLCVVTDSEWTLRHRDPHAKYFPETVDVELARYPSIPRLVSELESAGFEGIREELAEFGGELRDAAPFRDKVFSSLLYIDDAAFARGLARLERDLACGPVPYTSRYALVWATKPPQP